jgi:hypothetical protein
VGELRHISEVIEEMKPLEVDLYVCPECGQVGKLPQGLGSRYAAFCTGPVGADHKRVAKKTRKFREVIE